MADFKNRIIRAMKLEVSLYEEVEQDKESFPQAMAVVVLSSIAAGIGASLKVKMGIGGLFLGAIVALIGWYVWAGLTFLIGTRLLPEPQTRVDMGELLRTIGFSTAPGLIRILGIIPGLSRIVFFVAGIWMLVAMVIAVRQAFDYSSTWQAVGVCIVGWIIQAVILSLLLSFAAIQSPV